MNKFLSLIFCFLGILTLFSQEVELKKWTFFSEKNTTKVVVDIPHTWNNLDAFDDEPGYWRGKGNYTTQIDISNLEKVYFLYFKGVNQHTKVKVNNKLAGEHKGGYTAFDVNISEFLLKGSNKIEVEVDNRHNETIPPLDADFTFYGGLYRSVFLVEENPTHFKKEFGSDAVKIDALLNDNFQGSIEVNGRIFTKNKAKNHKVKFIIRNSNEEIVSSLVKKVKDTFSINLEIASPILWSPKSPNLYVAELQLYNSQNQLVDIYQHKIGFRKFEVSTSGFQLNGKPLKLVGVNRHQDFEGFGNAVPLQKQLQDLQLIKEMGSNFLRLAHYPQDKEIYKAADSLGLLLWSEIPVVNKVPSDANFLEYSKNSLHMQLEHIRQNYNHPSLVFIGYMNEIFLRMVFDKPEKKIRQKIVKNTLELATKLENLTRKEAPNHTTVMALHGNQIYNETGIADLSMVIGWNLYYGWYEGEINDLGGFLDSEHNKYPNRPLIISEYGVGADIRLHNSNLKKFDFSEEYQFKYHLGYYKQLMERPFVVGMSAWNFADFGSEYRGDAMPHINQKGLVNFNRTPKNIFFWYKATLNPENKISKFFKDLPIHINSSAKKNIKIISNQPVHFKINNKNSLKLVPVNGLIEHDIKLSKGNNSLRIYNNSTILQDSINLTYQKGNFKKSNSLAVNFGSENYFMDAENRIWTPVSQLNNIKIVGAIKKQKSSTNIRKTINDPLYQTSIKNIESIAIKLPKGMYEITLLFSELKKDTSLVFELNKNINDTHKDNSTQHLKINTKEISVAKLNPFNKVDISIKVAIENKLELKALNSQNFSICGMLIEKKK